MTSMNCPKCDADISESYQGDDFECGIRAGWFCDACDEPVGDDGYREPLEGDVGIPPAPQPPRGTPISQLSTRPGPKNDPDHPDHAKYAEWTRICRSYGFD